MRELPPAVHRTLKFANATVAMVAGLLAWEHIEDAEWLSASVAAVLLILSVHLALKHHRAEKAGR